MRLANRITSILLFLFGIYVLVEALKFDYMVEGTPGPGFLPFWVGLSISLLALIPLAKTFTQFASKLVNPFQKGDFKNFFIVIGSSIGVILITPLTGLLTALGLMVGVICKLLGTKSWKMVIGLTIVTPVALYLIFDVILGVPLPKGILGF